MDFVPRPENDFKEFIEMYYYSCRRKFPKLQAIAGKWTFEDLIPGMSDFDTRLICSDDMQRKDWGELAKVVGEVHNDLCVHYPKWDRKLEHLAGVNMTWQELTIPGLYYTEFKQWSVYNCANQKRLRDFEETMEKRPWDDTDEYYHLKRFLTFFGPYIRGIDPAINLGEFENKYPLHSRFMHYFTLPVQSAVSIITKKTIKGKFEAQRMAKKLFPGMDIFDDLFDAVQKHYEIPELYSEPLLGELEKKLHDSLISISEALKEHITILPKEILADTGKWKKYISEYTIDPRFKVLDATKFCRFMKERLRFYANAPEHFDSKWLIRNDLNRMRNNIFCVPYLTYWEIFMGEKKDDPDELVPRMVPDILTSEEAAVALEFSKLLSKKVTEGEEIEKALAVSELFDGFLSGLEKITGRVKEELSLKKDIGG